MTEKRRSIILKVEELTTLWIQKCLRANDLLPEHNIIESSSYICTFGSYELNAHFESSDIDVLCIGPKYITHSMLFKDFVEILQEDKRVTDILVLRHAFVPLLKFTFEGIDIDLVYAQWDIDIISIDKSTKYKQINVFSKQFLNDKDTLLSLNGVRSTQTIKKLIPNKNYKLFEKSLKIIKFWAQQRAIYSNVMGFLGGISWSIMTAKICIQYPNLKSCIDILKQFFKFYKDYNYSCDSIHLDSKLYDDMYENGTKFENLKSDSNDMFEYQRNQYTEIMPILTPARPAMNCAYNVIEPTKQLIIEELNRGYEILNNLNNLNSKNEKIIDWNKLFSKRHFVEDIQQKHMYNDYENVYIRIQCIPDANNLFNKKWTGFIESKIRNLVKKLNRELFDSTFYPYANSIKYGTIDIFFISGKYNIDFDHQANNEDAIEFALRQFQTQIDTSSVRYSCGSKCQLKIDILNTIQIHQILSEYKNYSAQINAIKTNTNTNINTNTNANANTNTINSNTTISIPIQTIQSMR
eukprot:439124_1